MNMQKVAGLMFAKLKREKNSNSLTFAVIADKTNCLGF